MDIFRTNGCKVVNVIHLIIKLHTHIYHVITCQWLLCFINILNLKVSKCYVWSTHSQCRVKILNIAQMAITFLLLHILV